VGFSIIWDSKNISEDPDEDREKILYPDRGISVDVDTFWQGVQQRAIERNPNWVGGDVFEVEYSVGIPEEVKDEEAHEGEWREYEEFDGEDYLIRVFWFPFELSVKVRAEEKIFNY